MRYLAPVVPGTVPVLQALELGPGVPVDAGDATGNPGEKQEGQEEDWTKHVLDTAVEWWFFFIPVSRDARLAFLKPDYKNLSCFSTALGQNSPIKNIKRGPQIGSPRTVLVSSYLCCLACLDSADVATLPVTASFHLGCCVVNRGGEDG